MGKALYRVYRSKNLDELVGQEHITTTLDNSIKNGSVAHAYLFTGPRGVGKTSVARIFAHDINNLDYNIDRPHIDIIEIDAASNRRIDEIRDLRDKVHIAPTSAKYKVYIVDEVHMLTKEAFNALLKTLEEPPEHAVFILATTEFHKLPETIISRCLHFTFKPIDNQQVAKHLKSIAKAEKLNIDDDALTLIAEHGRGSFRDSISLLDQIRNTSGKITRASVEHAIGHVSEKSIEQIINHISTGEVSKLISALESSYTYGATPESLAKQISFYLRDSLVNKEFIFDQDKTIKLLKALVGVPASQEPKSELELLLIEASLGLQTLSVPRSSVAEAKTAPQPKEAPKPKKVSEIKAPTEVIVEDVVTKVIDNAVTADDDFWPNALEALKSKNRTLYGVARMAEVSKDSDSLSLMFNFAFHSRQMTENKAIISEIIHGLDPNITQINITHTPKSSPNPIPTTPKNNNYDSISNIFGPSEVLES